MFSKEWEAGYQNGRLLVPGSISEDLVIILSICPTPKKVLDFGCGIGTNSLLFRGAEYLGIDGSETIIEKARQNYPEARFMVGDFTEPLDIGDDFDIVFDRGGVTHNSLDGAKRAISNAFKALKHGGRYIGIDWMSDNHSEMARGIPLEDCWTRTGYPDGQFEEAGAVRFFSSHDFGRIFDGWGVLLLQERTVEWAVAPPFHWVSNELRGHGPIRFAMWDLMMVKP